MVIKIEPDLQAVLTELARRQGVTAEDVAIAALRERFLGSHATPQPQDEWERRLLAAGSDCGVLLPHSAVSSEGIYE